MTPSIYKYERRDTIDELERGWNRNSRLNLYVQAMCIFFFIVLLGVLACREIQQHLPTVEGTPVLMNGGSLNSLCAQYQKDHATSSMERETAALCGFKTN